MTRRAQLPEGYSVHERDGLHHAAVMGLPLGSYSTRRAALRRVWEVAAPVRRWTVSAEHPSLGCHEEPVSARTERGALRAARQVLAGRWSLAGWTWRVRDDRGELVASRRGDSVRGWCRPGGAS